MPTFATPDPITAAIDLPIGDVRVIASDRADTVVAVTAGSDADHSGVSAVRVDYADGHLSVTVPGPRGWGAKWGMSLFSLGVLGAVAVEIELPAGSDVRSTTTYGGFRGEGALGDCHVHADYGDIRLARARSVTLETQGGQIAVDHVDGDAQATNGAGAIRIEFVGGSAVLASDHGKIQVGEAGGGLRLVGANAAMVVDRALGDVEARNAYGAVRLGEVRRGTVDLTTTYGRLEIGIAAGTAAFLDVSTIDGRLRNHLDEHDGPGGFAETVEVRARTRSGDIVVRRA